MKKYLEEGNGMSEFITDPASEFIKNHANDDPHRLLLQYSGREMGFDLRDAVMQIECRRKTARKLSRFIAKEGFLFPDRLAAEQATDQAVAAYHASLVAPGSSVLDITAGLGIDSLSMAMRGAKVTACELDPSRAKILKENADALQVRLEVKNADSLEFLRDTSKTYDVIFADPARRDPAGCRTYFFADCLPDIVTHYPLMAAHSLRILVKASPIADISSIVEELPETSAIHIVTSGGECKEVLVEITPGASTGDRQLHIVNTGVNAGNTSEVTIPAITLPLSQRGHQKATVSDGTPAKYLYDPDSGVHKADIGDWLCTRFPGLVRASRDTDLYLSDTLYGEFPGRTFEITAWDSRQKGLAVGVAVRNYPLTARELAKKMKVRPAEGHEMLWGLRIGSKGRPLLLLAKRIH